MPALFRPLLETALQPRVALNCCRQPLEFIFFCRLFFFLFILKQIQNFETLIKY